jgi:heat shock protein HtpX
MEVVKTAILMIALTLLMVFIGGAFGGTQGMVIALFIAIGMNFFSYF